MHFKIAFTSVRACGRFFWLSFVQRW